MHASMCAHICMHTCACARLRFRPQLPFQRPGKPVGIGSWVTSRRRVGGEGACSHGGLRYRATRSGGTYRIVGCLLSDTSWKGSVRDMTSGLDPPPTSPPTRRRLVHGVEGGVASIDRSGGGGGWNFDTGQQRYRCGVRVAAPMPGMYLWPTRRRGIAQRGLNRPSGSNRAFWRQTGMLVEL